VPYQENIQAALEALREQEFLAGRFFQPTEVQPGFIGRLFGRKPSKPKSPATIREAIKIADSSAIGTRSILDMERISDTPAHNAAWLVPRDELKGLFGSAEPSREKIENCEELMEKIGSGQGVCIVAYRNGRPDGIYFAGYSFD
jgi:hypothetical protein